MSRQLEGVSQLISVMSVRSTPVFPFQTAVWFGWKRSRQVPGKLYAFGNWHTCPGGLLSLQQLIYNNTDEEQCACNVTDVVVLINCIGSFESASLLSSLSWSKLLWVNDSSVTHSGFAQPGGLLNSKVFDLLPLCVM